MSPALRVERLRSIEAELRRLRAQVVEVGAPQTADKIRSAIKSIGGAIRHAQRVAQHPAGWYEIFVEKGNNGKTEAHHS